MSDPNVLPPFRVAFVTGVVPDKWARVWGRRFPDALDLLPVPEADQLTGVRDGTVAMAFVRLPVDRDGLHLIPLYDERPVVVVAKEHPVAAFDEVDVTDLADEHLLQDPDDVPAWREVATELREGSRYPVPVMTLSAAVESVAAEAGIVVLPMSVARIHHRKDVVAVPVTGVPETTVGLAWRRDLDDPRAEAFVGVVRGRRENTSRDNPTPAAEAPRKKPAATKKATAKQTAADKAAARKAIAQRGRATARRRGRR